MAVWPYDHATDRLYGRIELPDYLRAMKEVVGSRQSGVSLCCTPAQMLPVNIGDSRESHGLGTAHLTILSTRRPAFAPVARNLCMASYLHDWGGGPFHHICEEMQVRLTGMSHEYTLRACILNSPKLVRIIRNHGGDPDTIVACNTHRYPPYGEIVAGRCFDNDNNDNVLRFLVSTGLLRCNDYRSSPFYSPEELAQAFDIVDGRLCLHAFAAPMLQCWAQARKLVYEFIYSPIAMAPRSMIKRAIDSAAEECKLPLSWFRMTDYDGLVWLRDKTTPLAKTLIERLEAYELWQCIYSNKYPNPSERLHRYLTDSETERSLTEHLRCTYRLNHDEIYVFTGKDNTYKEMNLPLYSAESGFRPIPSLGFAKRDLCQVYANPTLDKPKVHKIRHHIAAILAANS